MPKGRILKLNDGRVAIEYQNQPLLKQGKLIWYLVDQDLKPRKGEDGNPLVLLRTLADLNTVKVIGYID